MTRIEYLKILESLEVIEESIKAPELVMTKKWIALEEVKKIRNKIENEIG